MGVKAAKQSTLVTIICGMTLLLSVLMLVLSFMVADNYKDVLSVLDHQPEGWQTGKNLVNLTILLAVSITVCAVVSAVYLNVKVIKPISRLKNAMTALAEGDLTQSVDVSVNTSEIGQLSGAIIKTRDNLKALASEVDSIAQKSLNGDIRNAKGNTAAFKGEYQDIVAGINNILDAVIAPITEVFRVLEAMGVNDFTQSVDNKYRGDFSILADSINGVQGKLLTAQNIAVKVSQGDNSELENLRKIGKRSENDHLIPAFIAMMETIQNLIEETKTLAHAAAEGNLHARGDSSRYKGEYVHIINGINDIIEAAATPVQEIKDVLAQISQGNLNVHVKGNYKGDYLALTTSVNETTRTLQSVINEISNILLRIGQNDLNIEEVKAYTGNFALISDSLNKIITSLNQTMREINSASEQVAAGAGQIAAASQTLSQGSEQQASAIEEVTVSINEMAAQVKNNAVNASQANELGLTARDNAIKGNEQMKTMLQAMHDINESSANISKIIKVIDDIAFQTNILALNAAVEAARAGQYGKGFAVVADEVRNLAQRSANAAKETTALIESSIDKVEAGTKIANNTAQALHEIVDSVSKAATLVSQISSASNEQAAAITQINQAMDQVSQVVQTNSATAQESASASEELSSQAEMLKHMVNKFRLKAETYMGFSGVEGLSPDILHAIEGMMEKKDLGRRSEEVAAGASHGKPQILLYDTEFGKY